MIAGGTEADTAELIEIGRGLLGANVVFLQGVSREKMPGLFRAADVFALASLTEMMPIAVLEAIATGLPVICSDTPTFRWMAGRAGLLADLSVEDALAAQIRRIAEAEVREPLACAARAHAEANFSEAVIVEQILKMYASGSRATIAARAYAGEVQFGMSDNAPRVSVVIPAYNAAAYLRRALHSVLAQTVPAHEIIVVDDGSEDGTADYVERTFPMVRVLRQPNGGPGAARNRGVREASGDWIGLWDADDMWLPEKLGSGRRR